MSTVGTDPREYDEVGTGRSRPAPAPGAESVGPPLAEFVLELARTRQALEQLTREARADARQRFATGVKSGNTDSNGDLGVHIFEVPQGAVGHLVLCSVDEAGVTPAAPDTAGTLWHAIYAGPPGESTAAQVRAVGNLLDCQPLTPAADAQIPHAYSYGGPWSAPTLRGPESFWLLIDGATATRQIAVRYFVVIEQPDS